MGVLLTGRFLLLGAEAPPWFAPSVLVLHLGEGYKTLSAENLADWLKLIVLGVGAALIATLLYQMQNARKYRLHVEEAT